MPFVSLIASFERNYGTQHWDRAVKSLHRSGFTKLIGDVHHPQCWLFRFSLGLFCWHSSEQPLHLWLTQKRLCPPHGCFPVGSRSLRSSPCFLWRLIRRTSLASPLLAGVISGSAYASPAAAATSHCEELKRRSRSSSAISICLSIAWLVCA